MKDIVEYAEVSAGQSRRWIPTRKEDAVSNQLIEAYMSGKRDGMEQQSRLIMNKLAENINKSGKIASDLFDELKKNGFTPMDAYLRINSWERFDMMITVPEIDILKEEFLEMYDRLSEIEKDCEEEFYGVFISFCYVNEAFDEHLVSSDGYYLKFQ